ncbi:MAG TPA: TatD family hydrolase [Candidatus Kapabacteria bacterium]|nr:TatD family hydrolase [Candidatus Kapabacteria bacterium]
MIDTHCHIQVNDFDEDREAVLQRAQEEGVEAIIVPAIDEPSFEPTLSVAQNDKENKIFCGIGVHPHHAAEINDNTLERIELLMKEPKVVAVGEIGLDYHYNFSAPEVQRHIFREQLRIAKRANKPVIVHNRESDKDMLKMVEEEQDGTLHGVFHCFSSTVEMLRRALAADFLVSFTANITFKNSMLGEIVQEAPLEKIMIETDSPWMSPPPWRGKRNEPARVKKVAEKIAEIKNITMEEVVKQTTANAKKFFALTICALFFLIARPGFAQEASTQGNGGAQQTDTTKPAVIVQQDYHRDLGVGVQFGGSTVIGTSATQESGLFCFGGRMVYMPTRSLGFELNYSHFRDNKHGLITRADSSDYYTTLDFSLRLVANPSNRVAVTFLLGGAEMFFSTPPYVSYTIGCVQGALNISANLPFTWGMLAPFGEYRVEVQAGQDHKIITPVTFGVMYYFPEGFRY